MAKRCGCSGGGGGVSLTAELPLTISGVGSAQDPFVVHIGDLDISDLVTEGRNITISGSGIETEPFAIAVNPGAKVESTPATAGSTTIAANESLHYFDHSATIATHTIVMPGIPTALGEEITFFTKSAITTLTINDDAGAPTNTFQGAPTTMAANSFFRLRLIGTVWVRTG